MLNLEDIDTKEQIIKEFYEWLFDEETIINKSVILEKEVDLSLAPYYKDAYVYYPQQIAKFFQTQAMIRLGKICQLGLSNDIYPNAYHNRLEHSKGVYNRKLEEFLQNFQDKEWKENIEKNNLKLFLLADLIKMAGHDIGHLPLSHLMENVIFSYKGAHEDIGKRIILEDTEIQSILDELSPKLHYALKQLYEKPIMNFREHDESNFDVDRFDYVSRDYFYIGSPIHLKPVNYKRVQVAIDEARIA